MRNLFLIARLMRTLMLREQANDDRLIGTDRRQGTRWQAFCFVEICNLDGSPLIDATVREISAFGAQLRLKSAGNLPDKLIVCSQPDRICNCATVKWISGVSIGVRFDNEVQNPGTLSTVGDRLRIVESHLFGRPGS